MEQWIFVFFAKTSVSKLFIQNVREQAFSDIRFSQSTVVWDISGLFRYNVLPGTKSHVFGPKTGPSRGHGYFQGVGGKGISSILLDTGIKIQKTHVDLYDRIWVWAGKWWQFIAWGDPIPGYDYLIFSYPSVIKQVSLLCRGQIYANFAINAYMGSP